MAFINFKDQWFQELRKVNWYLSGNVWRKSAGPSALPGTGKGAQPSLSGGRTGGKPDSAEQESPCYKKETAPCSAGVWNGLVILQW